MLELSNSINFAIPEKQHLPKAVHDRTSESCGQMLTTLPLLP